MELVSFSDNPIQPWSQFVAGETLLWDWLPRTGLVPAAATSNQMEPSFKRCFRGGGDAWARIEMAASQSPSRFRRGDTRSGNFGFSSRKWPADEGWLRLLTSPDMSSSLIHAGEGARKPKCARCRNHGVISWLKVFSCKTRILMNFSQLCLCRGTSGVASSGTVTARSATSYKSGRGSWRRRFLNCGILMYFGSDKKEDTGRHQK